VKFDSIFLFCLPADSTDVVECGSEPISRFKQKRSLIRCRLKLDSDRSMHRHIIPYVLRFVKQIKGSNSAIA